MNYKQKIARAMQIKEIVELVLGKKIDINFEKYSEEELDEWFKKLL